MAAAPLARAVREHAFDERAEAAEAMAALEPKAAQAALSLNAAVAAQSSEIPSGSPLPTSSIRVVRRSVSK